jgi:YVTN family beta-propeller protein
MFMQRLATLAVAVFASAGLAAASATPNFSYSPIVIKPGGMLSFTGNSFNPSSAGVNISMADPSGKRTTLGAAALNAGVFARQFTAPSTITPGLYSINVVDSSGDVAINTTGTLTVVAAMSSWFQFGPDGLSSGQSLTLGAAGFQPVGSPDGAAVALVSSTGKLTVLGGSALTNGGFVKNFTVPQLAPDTYSVIVKDLFGQNAVNATGPLTVGTSPPSVPVGFYPVGVAVNQASNRVYVPNSGDNTLSVLDGATNSVLATIPVGRLPCAIAVNPATDRVYVSNVNSNDVSVIDGSTNQVIQTVSVGRAPCAATVTPLNNRIFVGNYADNTISVIDGATNTRIHTIATSSTPAGLGANFLTGRVYSVNGSGTVSVIDAGTFDVLAVVPVGLLPDAVGVNLVTNRIYVGNFMSQSVSVIDGNSNSVIATIPVGLGPSGVGVDSTTNRIFVGNYMSNNVSVIDGATNKVVATIPVGVTPDGIAVNGVSGRVYSADSNSNSVAVIQQ